MVVVGYRSGFEPTVSKRSAGKAERQTTESRPDNAIRITIGPINGPVTQLYHILPF